MDLVKIGFLIKADGLKDANTEVEKLLTKVDKVGKQGKQSAADFETSQKKVKESSKEVAKEVDKTSKALEKQKLIGDYLGKGLDKTTAASLANFKQLKAGVVETNSMFTLLGNNSTLDKTNKQAKAVTDSLDKMKLNLELVGKGFSASEQAQLRQLKLNGATNDQLEEAVRLIKKRKQAEVLADYKNQKPALQREWMEAYDKEIAARVAKQQEAAAKMQQVRDTVSNYEAKSRQSFGGGILDQVERQNQGLLELRKQYTDEIKAVEAAEEKARQKKFSAAQQYYQQQMELLAKETAAQKAAAQQSIDEAEKARQKKFAAVQKEYQQNMELLEKERNKVKQADAEREKTISLEQAKAKYVKEGFGKTDAGRLARLEVSGADVNTLTKYKDAIESTRSSMRNFAPVALTATKSNNTLLNSVKGIAAYALLSTAIYGTITALTDLAVSIVSTADEMTNLTQRLNIYLPANIKVNQVLERMGEIAKENRVTLADTGKLFTQLLPPVQRIKGGVAETTAIVDAFGKAMLVGGANTMEAASATIQFGQAMASGKLAGDEFRSLAEASPRLLQAIADGAGIAAQKLKEMSSAGELNTPLISAALLDQMLILQYEAAQMGQTVSGAFNEGMVAYQLFVNEFNEQTGFTEGLVESIRAVVRSLEGFGKSFLASLKDGNSTLNSYLHTWEIIWDLVKAVVGGFIDVVGWLVKAGEETGLWKTYFDTVGAAVIAIVDTLVKIPFVIVDIGTRIAELVLKPFENFIKLAQTGLDLAGFDSAAARLGQGLSNYRGFMGDIKGTTGEVITGINLLSLGVDKTAESTGNVNDLLSKLKQKNQDLVIQEKEKKALTDKQAIDEYAKFLLQQNGVAVTAENLKLVKEELQEYYKITQEQAKQLKLDGEKQLAKDEAEAKAKKAAEKTKKAAEQEQKRLQGIRDGYQDQIASAKRLQMLLDQGKKLDVARIASQKDYFDVYKGNLDVATQLAAIQEKTRKEESRQEYDKSLKSQIEQLDVIAGLTAEGADYETAKALAAAGFANDSRGRLAAEKTLMNTLTGQSYALSDQITEQETLNRYLKEGMGIEEARFKVALSRIAKLSKGKNVYNQFGEDYENAMKSLRVKKATEASEIKINSILRESGILTKAIALGYTTSNIAVSKLAGATQGLLFSQAETQLKQQDELDLLYENAKARVKINSLLSGESEALRAVKDDYATIGDFEAERVVQLRKSLELAESYANKMKEQKANPLGDFSNVDFEVFGSFGNPFKEALDGLNSLISGSSKLDESLAIVAAQISDLQVQAFVEDMFGNQTAVENITSQIEKQLGLEKDLQKQKAETNDIAYGRGLKFAKSFFKENSKGYKVVSALEMALQAKKIAFSLWEKKDTIAFNALKLQAYITDTLGFTTGAYSKIVAQQALNVAQAQGAVAASANAPPPFGFASAAAMIALLAGIGIAISGGGGSYVDTSNQGTGTVFGDTEAQSASIKNSIEILSENSDLMLPLTSAMLASLKNIESSIGGVTNLVIRQATGEGFNIAEGFKQNGFGKALANPTVGALGGSAMGAMGALAIAGPIGLVVGALLGPILGKALGGLFGSKTTIKGQGLFADTQKLGDIIIKGFDLFEYVDVQIKKKAFGITTSTKNKTQFRDADKALENQFTLIFSGFYDSILKASTSLGANMDTVKGNLENAVIRLGKIDLKGLKGDEIQEKLEAVFGAAADSLAQQGFAGLDDFQKVGEGYYETLIRVASSVEQASYYTDRLNVSAIKYTDILNKQGDVAAEIVRQSVLLVEGNKNIKGGFYDLVNAFDGTAEELSTFVVELRDLQDQLFMTGKNADYLTSSMILGAGGLEGLSSGLDAYFEMLSPAEQAAELTRRLTNEFAIFGKELPADVKAFRNLVSSIDITTEAGQKLYGQIIALAPEFNDLQDALDSANSEVNALVQSLRDLAEQARGARGETDQTRNLASVRNEFDRVSALAMQGDTEAANRLLTLGKDLMQVSKLYALSGSEYAKDLALIQRAATVAADIQANGLGTSISPTLTPSTNTTTTPTVETTNTSTDSKLDALREDLNAALLAIAKYTQSTASKLENWDGGDRMTVRIEQFGSNDKIPVSTA